jgi:hypothetical protein
MMASIPRLQSALNFAMNGILMCQGSSQIFELFRPAKGFITCLYVVILSSLLVSTHDHTK